ncbi:MAG: hypothetical protein ACKO4Q_16725 [Planctomycetota bacterium]
MELRTQGGRRTSWAALLACCALLLALAPLARAQDTSLEDFSEVDPYTKGDPAALERLGIMRTGSMPWTETHTSDGVRETLGGVPVIFLETAHFRIASTLETYKPKGDAIEKELLEAEFAAFKKRNRGFKAPAKLDPWLRAHLYAQRCEKLYADFTRAFGIKGEDFLGLEAKAKEGRPMGQGPYLGQKNKYTVLVTESTSAMARYLKAHFQVELEYSYRAKWPDGYFLGTNFEAFEQNGRDLDVCLHTALIGALAQNLLDGYRDSHQAPPNWLRYGLAHWFARKIDTRWNQWNAGGTGDLEADKLHIWEPRVFGLVKNEACTSWAKMMGWKGYEDIQPREHMVAWAAVDWILTARADTARALLYELAEPLNDYGPERPAKLLAQQERAFRKVWDQSPAELDKAFGAWVLKTYRK